MAESNIFLSEGFIGAVIGAIGTYIVTRLIERQKENNYKEDIKNLVKTDLDRQLTSINRIEDQYKIIKKHIQSDAIEYVEVNTSYVIFHNTEVHDNLSLLDQLKTFGSKGFSDLSQIYTILKNFYRNKPFKVVEDYRDEWAEIRDSGSASVEAVKEIHNTAERKIDTNLLYIDFFKKNINGFLADHYSSDKIYY